MTKDNISSTISIVRFIPCENDESSRILRLALLNHFHAAVVDFAKEVDLSLTNKYFDAKVRFADISNAKQDEKYNTLLNGIEDGIILTFTDSKTDIETMIESFNSVHCVHDLAQSLQQCGDVLRLCIAISTDNEEYSLEEALLDKERQRRILWCLDRGYEYIEADMSKEGLLKGHEDREKEGYARVLEAFQATLWSSAVKAGRTKEIRPENLSLKDAHVVKKNSCPDMNVRITTQKDENYFENLDRVMKEAVRIRDDAKGGSITDDERRKRAGDAAIALMGLLGLDDDEEDSDME